MRKGFVINKELLINGGKFTDQYFDELLEVIREIRASERKKLQIYLQQVMIIMKMQKLLKNFSLMFKISYIMQFQVKLLQN